MKRFLRGLSYALVGVAAIGLLAVAVVYGMSEYALRRTYDVPTTSVAIPTDSTAIAEGRRLATLHGCFNGCHGEQAEGVVFLDEPKIARIVAPNLTHVVRDLSDAELAVAIRQGLLPDGRTMVVMPAESFMFMNDQDLGRIIAFLRSLPEQPGPDRLVELGPIGRVGLVSGRFKTAAQYIADGVPPPEAASEQASHGRYLALTTCAQCHGMGLQGASFPDFTSPSLHIVAGYSPEAFTALLRNGQALGGREVGLMSRWARKNLSVLTDEEIAALYGYLHSI
jgi:mono/diheme cytochrome c family protein